MLKNSMTPKQAHELTILANAQTILKVGRVAMKDQHPEMVIPKP